MADGGFQRNTRQRRLILEELEGLTSHPTAADLHQIVRQRLPQISLGTIYRNLELLARTGAIRRLEAGGGAARFDANTEPHGHLRCVRCGALKDVHDIPLDLEDTGFGDLDGYDTLGYRLEFVGICPACKAAAGLPADEMPKQAEDTDANT